VEDLQNAVTSLVGEGITGGNVELVNGLIGVGAVCEEKTTQLADARLPPAAEALYHSACDRGAVSLLDLAVAAVHHVYKNPHTIRAGAGARASRSFDFGDVSKHSQIRFACYKYISSSLNYAGNPRIPLPHVCETFVKAAWPGGEFTGFIPSAVTEAAPVVAAAPPPVYGDD
jgi:hypothetical protein